MAEKTTTRKTNSFAKKNETAEVKEDVVTEVIEVDDKKDINNEETTSVPTSKKNIKKFKPEDLILCESVCGGKTYYTGIKTNNIYTFEALGAEEYVEYKDLVASVRSRDSMLFKPFIMVMDEDFINEQTRLKSFYESMYTPEDFEEFFTLTPAQMIEALDNMPSGIKDTIKNMAAGKISEGSFDSVARIKALDNYFGTRLMLLTELYEENN